MTQTPLPSLPVPSETARALARLSTARKQRRGFLSLPEGSLWDETRINQRELFSERTT